jgi:TRAP-type uncharacterized transport system substrate-binding protein
MQVYIFRLRKEGLMKGKTLFIVLLSIALVFMAALPAMAKGKDVSAVLRSAGDAVGGVGFVMLTALTKVVTDAYPKIRITVIPGGWVGNIARVNSGEVDLASTSNTL